jgi:RecB family exonuclease
LLGPARDDPLAEERRLFGLATGAATTRVVATAGPEPGQLLSRFVAGWDPVDHRLDWTWCEEGADGAGPLGDTSPVETRGVAPVWPDGTLMLSASKLMTFADCPLQYGFSYALRVRDEGNVWASLGSLFHAVAAEFLRPGQDADFTEERLFDIAESHWSDDIAPYRPQREEIRRDLYEMLRAWRDTEFAVGPGPDVFDVEHWFTMAAGLEIIDYKTSKHPMREDEVADDLQLAVYHLAACRDPALAAEGQTARLVLRYVRAGKDVEQPVDAEGPQQTEARIVEAAEEILAEAFTPAIGADCSHCDFHRLCPLQRAGREVGAS